MCSLDANFNALVLEAQAVPRADRVPCIRALPAGWSVFSTDIESGRARFALSSDRAGSRALEVTFTSGCDTSGATEIPSDQTGTRRFERIEVVTPGFKGTRYYRFAGGCASYRFQLGQKCAKPRPAPVKPAAKAEVQTAAKSLAPDALATPGPAGR